MAISIREEKETEDDPTWCNSRRDVSQTPIQGPSSSTDPPSGNAKRANDITKQLLTEPRLTFLLRN
jgi:hypothetical protein